MTDNEIIKALECCMDEMGCTKGCPCFDPKAKGSHCTVSKKLELEKLTLDLINRQKAEIERLKEELKVTRAYIHKNGLEWGLISHLEFYKNLKAEAYKEFADLSIKRICEQVSAPTPSESYIVEKCNQTIENLLKEMVGEDK